MYRGYFYDVETGLYYLQSRYYDPETGRFINADDTVYIGYDGSPISTNIFAYCANNPVKNSDHNGKWYGKRSYDITIMSSLECRAESSEFAKEFPKMFYGKIDNKPMKVNISKKWSNSKSGFIKNWNSIKDNQDFAVLIYDGSAESISKGIKTKDFNKLKYKNINCLILIICNAAHQSKIWNNLAYYFHKKISGVVVASDGTVVHSPRKDSKGFNQYTSYGDYKWSKLYGNNPPKSNKGWMLYHDKKCYSTTFYYENNTISLYTILHYLNDRRFISYKLKK